MKAMKAKGALIILGPNVAWVLTIFSILKVPVRIKIVAIENQKGNSYHTSSEASLLAPTIPYGLLDEIPARITENVGIVSKYNNTIVSPTKPSKGLLDHIGIRSIAVARETMDIMGAPINPSLQALLGIIVSFDNSFIMSAYVWYHVCPLLPCILALILRYIQIKIPP